MSVKAIDEIPARMTWVKVLVISVLVAILAFMLGPIIWPPPRVAHRPPPPRSPSCSSSIWCRPRSWGWGSPSSPSGCP